MLEVGSSSTDDPLRRIQEGQSDPAFVITHSVGPEDGPEMEETYRDKKEPQYQGCSQTPLR